MFVCVDFTCDFYTEITVPEMTYNVFSGTLNPTHYHYLILKSVRFDMGYHLNNIQMCYFRI